MTPGNFVDHYEALQLSPNADLETIGRVFRLQAQRFHPDNPDTGDVDTFRRISDAHRILSDPAQRAGYDVLYQQNRGHNWRIFNQSSAARGMSGEKSKRAAILSILYTKRMNESHQPFVTLLELEQLLACPREHLEFGLWYLRETQQIQRSDNARYTITAKGVETLEANEASPISAPLLLTEAEN
jgi:curved DNA-binding protein CbpA